MLVDVESVRTLPCPEAAEDVVVQWIGIADKNARLFSEQAIIDAERGDIDAALYASSAAEFAAKVSDRLRELHAEILLIATVMTLARICHLGDYAHRFAFLLER